MFTPFASIEEIVYSILNFVPYLVLALLPFWGNLRFRRPITFGLFVLFGCTEVFLFCLSDYLDRIGIHLITLFSILMMINRLFFYFLLIRAKPGRMLFTLLIVKNYADAISVFSVFLNGILFPDYKEQLYDWHHILCLFLIQAVLFVPLLLYINTFFSQKIRDSISSRLWSYLWLIPVLFYCIWVYVFYYSSDLSALDMALQPMTNLFMAILIAGQSLVYICLSKLVQEFHKTVILTQENHQLSAQRIHDQVLQEKIKEVTVLRHDMRHRLVELNHYVEQQDCDGVRRVLDEQLGELSDSNISYCKNLPLNIMLVYYHQRCRQQKIPFELHLRLPETLPLTESEITVLFGNLLENAYDANIELPVEKRNLVMQGGSLQNTLLFTIENPFQNQILPGENGTILSTKHSSPGIGIESSRFIVAQHGGAITFEQENSIFRVTIQIPNPPASSEA